MCYAGLSRHFMRMACVRILRTSRHGLRGFHIVKATETFYSSAVVMTCFCDDPTVFYRSTESLWVDFDQHEHRVGGQVGHVQCGYISYRVSTCKFEKF